MKHLSFLLLVAVVGCNHEKPVEFIHTTHNLGNQPGFSVPPYSTVEVVDCVTGKMVPIYQDYAATVAMTNPIVADRDGHLEFYAKPPYCMKNFGGTK